VTLMAFYLHLGPFARQVIAAIDARLAELDLATVAAASGARTQVLVAALVGDDA
jgi:hypothetical protein